jgi:hypothetical protein
LLDIESDFIDRLVHDRMGGENALGGLNDFAKHHVDATNTATGGANAGNAADYAGAGAHLLVTSAPMSRHPR